MDEITLTNFLKAQGRFSAIEAAIRLLAGRLQDPASFKQALKAQIEPTIRHLWSKEDINLMVVAESMRETMEALLDMS